MSRDTCCLGTGLEVYSSLTTEKERSNPLGRVPHGAVAVESRRGNIVGWKSL